MFFNNFNTPKLNSESIAIVKDLYNQLIASKAYPNFKLSFNDKDNGGSSSISLFNPNNGRCVLKYMFFALDKDGEIRNIAIYGSNLDEFYETINRSKNIFGFKVSNISLELENTQESFVDIYIDSYGLSNESEGEIKDFETEISMLNLEPVRKLLETNKAGRKYRIIDYKMVYQGMQTYAAIIPAVGKVVAPIVVGNDSKFIATGEILQEELMLYLNKFGG